MIDLAINWLALVFSGAIASNDLCRAITDNIDVARAIGSNAPGSIARNSRVINEVIPGGPGVPAIGTLADNPMGRPDSVTIHWQCGGAYCVNPGGGPRAIDHIQPVR